MPNFLCPDHSLNLSLQLLMALTHALKMALMMLTLVEGDHFGRNYSQMKYMNISRLSCVAAENNIFVAANYASVVKGMLKKEVFFREPFKK